jgi:hypothetical protein
MNRIIHPSKSIGFLLFLFFAQTLTAQKITEIKGYAPNYVGKQLEIYQIVDYISKKQERIASTTVLPDSSFSCSFYLDETRKLFVKSNNNAGFLFAAPGSTYEVVLPNKDPYAPDRPAGNQVQLIFLNLDSKDINYKILAFDEMLTNFVAKYYTKNNADSVYFVKRLDLYKQQLSDIYKADTLDQYFNYHRKFSIARLDNLKFYGNRNKYEKYDFYIRYTPVYYQNEAYMEYIIDYYDEYLKTVNSKVNNDFYQGVLRSSPSAVYNGLGKDYTMQHNYKLREMMMIKFLGDCYYDKEYPRSNLLTILDSLQKKSLFPDNQTIANAMHYRLTELVEGGTAPDFTIPYNGELFNLKKFEGKHLYLIFMDPNSVSTKSQLDLLVPTYQKYQSDVRFLLVLVGENDQKAKDLIKSYPWQGIVVDEKAEILSKYNIVTKPSYVIVDRIGYVVQAPALGPLPNGNRQTVDQIFFEIKRSSENQEQK